MSWYDEDFYCEPSEFEEQMDEFKESLAKSVKAEFLEEMEKLKKENKNLQGIKANFEQVKRDYERKQQECERVMREAEARAKRMRVRELMENYEIFLWGVTWEYLYGPKCDKCNKNRDIEITLPSGKVVTDDCECSKNRAKVMMPRRMVLYELADRNSKIVAWYTSCGKEDDRYYKLDCASSVVSKNIIEPGTSFDEVEKLDDERDVMFRTREECLAYCEYLNEKNLVPTDTVYTFDGSILERKED